MFFIIGPLWLIALIWLITMPFRIAPRATVVVLGVFMLIGWLFPSHDHPSPDVQRMTAMKTGVFDCRAAVAANDYETYTRHDVWNYCAGAFGGEAQWQAFLKADEDRRGAEDAQRQANDGAAAAAKDREMVEAGQRSLKR